MSPERVWTDIYGCPRALWSGLPGGHRWLIVAPPRLVGEVASKVGGLRFKGSLHLIATEDVTPTAGAAREVSPRGAIVVGRTLSGGPGVSPEERWVDLGGLSYREGGALPGWTSALHLDAGPGESAAASALAEVGVPVVSASPADLARVLQMWWAQTPHSLVHA